MSEKCDKNYNKNIFNTGLIVKDGLYWPSREKREKTDRIINFKMFSLELLFEGETFTSVQTSTTTHALKS